MAHQTGTTLLTYHVSGLSQTLPDKSNYKEKILIYMKIQISIPAQMKTE